MNPSNTPHKKQFSWGLPQKHIKLLADFLFTLMTFFNTAQSSGLAEQTACLLTDLREQCERAGAADPLDGMPLFPRFEDTESSVTCLACVEADEEAPDTEGSGT